MLTGAVSAIRVARAIHRFGNAATAKDANLRSLLDAGMDALGIVDPAKQRAALQIVDGVRELAPGLTSRLIEGQYRVVEDGGPGRMPWAGFTRWATAQTYGGHIVMGSIGRGKTTTARRICEVARATHGYPIDAFNIYDEDMPEDATKRDIALLVERAKRLQDALTRDTVPDNAPVPPEYDEEDDGRVIRIIRHGGTARKPQPESVEDVEGAIGHSAWLVDESGLSGLSSPQHPVRRAGIQMLFQCRHIAAIIAYVAQSSKQLPEDIFSHVTLWLKQPDAGQWQTERDLPILRAAWEEAEEAFSTLRRSEWWPLWPDERYWSYVVSTLGGRGRFRGLVPLGPARRQQAA